MEPTPKNQTQHAGSPEAEPESAERQRARNENQEQMRAARRAWNRIREPKSTDDHPPS